MGSNATNKKAVAESSKKNTIQEKPAQIISGKKNSIKSKTNPKKTTSKKKKSFPAQYEMLILEHRENGRKLARSILRRWRVHMPAEDIDSIVDLGLCEAAQRFSPEKGASFMTFFFYHLRGHLVRAVARATQASTILNGPKEDEDNDSSNDIISSYGTFIDNELNAQRDQENPEQIILRREKIVFCRDAMNALDSLEKVVLERSYGGDETLVDIAKSLGYSRCHISRVKKAALQRLKSVLSHSSFSNEFDEKVNRKQSLRPLRNEKTARRKIGLKNTDIKKSDSKVA
jgi:RNA polymerase sigma factor (sigma-70 family)